MLPGGASKGLGGSGAHFLAHFQVDGMLPDLEKGNWLCVHQHAFCMMHLGNAQHLFHHALALKVALSILLTCTAQLLAVDCPINEVKEVKVPQVTYPPTQAPPTPLLFWV